jgi:hypothetical protein
MKIIMSPEDMAQTLVFHRQVLAVVSEVLSTTFTQGIAGIVSFGLTVSLNVTEECNIEIEINVVAPVRLVPSEEFQPATAYWEEPMDDLLDCNGVD